MKSFKIWLVEEIQGEYWIDNYGYAQYADGNIGDTNHEGHVINLLQNQIAVGYDHKYGRGEYVDWDKFKKDITTKYSRKYPKVKNLHDLWRIILKDLGVSEADFSMAEGMGDARLYAMQHWGWKRVAGNDIETWNLTPKDMKIIATGIGNILDVDGHYDDEPSEDETYNVYVYSTKQSHEFTLAELEAGHAEPEIPHVQHHANASNNYIKNQETGGFYKTVGDWNLNLENKKAAFIRRLEDVILS